MRARIAAYVAVILSLAFAFEISSPATSALAADRNDFDPGYIISDEEFYDANSMTAAQIQTFLNSKVTRCEPERSNGPQDPIVCLKDYRINTVTIPADSFCKGTYQGANNETAATIIYKVAQACGINPKVLIVTLQKEQGLVTHTWPSSYRYDKAMGFACPDTAPCDSQYFGLQNQIYRAARQFQRYKANPGNYGYRAGMVNTIAYYPLNQRPQCGAGDVFIKNVATASLYNYTPYQPNAAALNNLYGTGDNCSSYGNRNFWRDYSDWFNDPVSGAPTGVTASRIGGKDRYEVAVGISAQYFPSGAPTVYIATGENFPDALSAATAATMGGGPLLLVTGKSIPASVKAELQRLQPETIVVSGGPATVADSVLNELGQYAPTVTRISGANRFEVSRNVTRSAFGETGSSVAYIATGATFADALSASAAAGTLGAPVILVEGTSSSLDADTKQVLQELGVTTVRIAGGPASVSTGIEADLKKVPGVTSVVRYTGADRFVVSGAVNRAAFTSADTAFIASGLTFPDALAGAAVAGMTGSPLYVIPRDCLPKYVVDDIEALGVSKLQILGGTGSIASSVESFAVCR